MSFLRATKFVPPPTKGAKDEQEASHDAWKAVSSQPQAVLRYIVALNQSFIAFHAQIPAHDGARAIRVDVLPCQRRPG